MDLITLDFETYYDKDLSLTKLTTMDYVRHDRFKVWGVGVKINNEPTEWYGEEETEAYLSTIDWSNAIVLCHNTMFDAYILTHYYNLFPAYYLDTAAMSRGWFPGQSASLAHTAERVFPHDESMRKGTELSDCKGVYDLSPEEEESLAGYCIQDVDLTYAIYHELINAGFPKKELDIIDLTCRMFVEPKLKIDYLRLKKYHQQEFDSTEQTIADAKLPRDILSSNQKFALWLDDVNIVCPMKPSPSKQGVSIPALGKNDAGFKQMCDMYPAYKHVWAGRTAVKSRLTETRSKRFLDAANDDNTIPVPLRYYAAHTGRFGGTEKLNMQNMPRNGELRKCLIAPDDHLIYVADLSNIEARMLAWLAGEEELLAQFRAGDDIYSNFASKIYGRPINKHDDPLERFVGKTAILGLGYGMGHKKFAATLKSGAMGPAMDFSEEQAKQVVDTYRASYPKIKMLWTKLEDLLKQSLHKDNYGYTYAKILTVGNRQIKLPNGMALKYHDLTHDMDGLTYFSRNKREYTYGGRITENVIQALSRIIITDSMLRLDKTGIGDVVLTVHDEVIMIGNNDNPSATMSQIIDDMCIAPEWALDIPLDAEGGFDRSYSK